MKRGGRGFKTAGGASFCHHCFKQLRCKPGGGFFFTTLLTPGDGYPVRVHDACQKRALADDYRAPQPP